MPADTGGYLFLGLAAITVIMVLFIGSMLSRYYNVKKDEEMLDQLK